MKLSQNSPIRKLEDPVYFRKAKLNNHTLSWDNVNLYITLKGKRIKAPFEIGADTLYQESRAMDDPHKIAIGILLKNERVKSWLTQLQLAEKSGTTRSYISKIENNASGIEISTLEKMVRNGLGKKLEISIKN